MALGLSALAKIPQFIEEVYDVFNELGDVWNGSLLKPLVNAFIAKLGWVLLGQPEHSHFYLSEVIFIKFEKLIRQVLIFFQVFYNLYRHRIHLCLSSLSYSSAWSICQLYPVLNANWSLLDNILLTILVNRLAIYGVDYFQKGYPDYLIFSFQYINSRISERKGNSRHGLIILIETVHISVTRREYYFQFFWSGIDLIVKVD